MTESGSGRCPACRATLVTRSVRGVGLAECPACHGIWLAADELRRVKDAADHDLAWLDFDLWKHQDRFRVSARAERCPCCDKPMVAVDYDKTGVEVHCCPACHGVWLDAGALERIITALEHDLVSKSAKDYLRETLKEAREIVTGKDGFVSEWRDFLTVAHLLELRFFVEHPALLSRILAIESANPIR